MSFRKFEESFSEALDKTDGTVRAATLSNCGDASGRATSKFCRHRLQVLTSLPAPNLSRSASNQSNFSSLLRPETENKNYHPRRRSLVLDDPEQELKGPQLCLR